MHVFLFLDILHIWFRIFLEYCCNVDTARQPCNEKVDVMQQYVEVDRIGCIVLIGREERPHACNADYNAQCVLIIYVIQILKNNDFYRYCCFLSFLRFVTLVMLDQLQLELIISMLESRSKNYIFFIFIHIYMLAIF